MNLLLNFVGRVATYLPGSWNSNLIVATNSLIRSDGLTLTVRDSYSQRGKLHISFSRPVNGSGCSPDIWAPLNAGRIQNPSINVSNTKTAVQVAKDIVRRLLPEAERVFKLANEAINQADTEAARKEALILHLAVVLNTKPDRHYQTNELTGKVTPYDELKEFEACGYGNFVVNSSSSISLKIDSMSAPVALDVARALRGIFLFKGQKA
jgi:hypothetical protein